MDLRARGGPTLLAKKRKLELEDSVSALINGHIPGKPVSGLAVRKKSRRNRPISQHRTGDLPKTFIGSVEIWMQLPRPVGAKKKPIQPPYPHNSMLSKTSSFPEASKLRDP